MKKSTFFLLVVSGILLLAMVFTSCSKDYDTPQDYLTNTTFVFSDGPVVVLGTVIWKIEFKENGKYIMSSSKEGNYGFTTRKTGTYQLVLDHYDIVTDSIPVPPTVYIVTFDGDRINSTYLWGDSLYYVFDWSDQSNYVKFKRI